MMRFLVVAVAALSLSACDDPEGATRTIQQAGMTPIAVGGYDWLACGSGDAYHTKFTAKNAQGMVVTGVVCRGALMKASTVRFD